MMISLLSIPKGIKKYYEVHKKLRRGGEGVYVIAYTTRDEAEEEAKKVGGWVVEINLEEADAE